jgi:hypothetical protein
MISSVREKYYRKKVTQINAISVITYFFKNRYKTPKITWDLCELV